MRSSAFAALSLMFATAAVAEEANFPLERFRPSTTRDGIIDVEWAGIGEHMQWDAAGWLHYQLNPLVLYDADGERVGALVAHRVGANLTGSLALWDWVEIAADLPVVIFQTRDEAALPDVVDASALSAVATGDLRLAPKVRLLRSAEQLVDLAIIPAVTLPTALPFGEAYAGEAQFTLVPEVAISRGFDDGALAGLRLASNLGYRLRPEERTLFNISVGHELTYKAGVGYRLHDVMHVPLEVDLSFAGATYAFGPFRTLEESPLETKLGVKYDLIKWPAAAGAGDSLVLQVFGGAGTGIINGFGTPDLRLFGGARIGPPKDIDADDDGIADKVDMCKTQPEDKDAHDDVDGCPDPDNDNDQIPDVTDKCANEAEDADGFSDDDGCPDLDNDGDYVKDRNDECPNVLGEQANKGCPWPDRDGDKIFDKDDACPDLSGVEAQKGCPDTDSDGITDAKDQCPTLAGPKEPYGGCPDTDEDGFTDDKDKCPKDAEIVNGVADDDGCPDEGKTLVTLTKEKIVILDKVFFDTGKATIKDISFPLLDQVATVIKSHSEIHKLRVEGHTDDVGADDKNQQLSQDRANSVRDYLVGKGVDTARLEAVGFGETKPIADNKTKDGKEQNRRVEFVIIHDHEVTPAPSPSSSDAEGPR